MSATHRHNEHNEDEPLSGRRLLVLEDDFFIGLEVVANLEALGAEVVGPYSSVAQARACLSHTEINGAVLDVNLGQETSLEFAEELVGEDVPIVFATAYADRAAMFSGALSRAPRLGKPVSPVVLQRVAVRTFGDR